MSNSPRRYSDSGTAIGPVTYDIQATQQFVPDYLEVHNLDSTNSLQVTLSDSSYVIPPGRVLKVPGLTPAFILNSASAPYMVLASVGYNQLPSVNDSSVATGVGGAYLADEVYLHLDVPTHTFTVKDGGLDNSKVDVGIVVDPGVGSNCYMDSSGGNFVAGEDVVVTLDGVPTTFKADTDFAIGVTGPLSLSALRVVVEAALDVTTFQLGGGAGDYVDMFPRYNGGSLLSLSTTSALVKAWNPTQTQHNPTKMATQVIKRTVLAQDVVRGLIFIILDTQSTIVGFHATLRSAAGTDKFWDGNAVASGYAVLLTDGGAINFVAGDILTVIVQHTVSP